MTRREWGIILYLFTVVIGVSVVTDWLFSRPDTSTLNSVEG